MSMLQYNVALKRLEALDVVASGQFAPLDEEASTDEVGVAAAHLAAYPKSMQGQGRVYARELMEEDVLRRVEETMRGVFSGGTPPRKDAPPQPASPSGQEPPQDPKKEG